MVDDLDADDFAFLQEGVDHKYAAGGIRPSSLGPGLNVGMAFERLVRQRLLCKDMAMAARILASAAADARMAGVKLPAMSSAGSGNHGLTAVLPIRAVKDYVECSDKVFLEAIALSHLLTAYVKTHTGRLSAVCGCSIAAGAGATAGITYLLGGQLKHIAGAITNLTEDLAGVHLRRCQSRLLPQTGHGRRGPPSRRPCSPCRGSTCWPRTASSATPRSRLCKMWVPSVPRAWWKPTARF